MSTCVLIAMLSARCAAALHMAMLNITAATLTNPALYALRTYV